MSLMADTADHGAGGPSPLDAALAYGRRGWLVFPVHSVDADGRCTCSNPECEHPGKHPRTPNGLDGGTTGEAQIREYWRRWPEANVAIVTGQVSGLLVLDIDPRHDGDESLEGLKRRCGGGLPETVEALTGGGSRHLLFRHPDREIRCAVAVDGLPGIDVRADRGYIVAPPSLHASGRRYEWEVSSHPDEVPLAALPEALLALVVGESAGGNGDGRPKKSLEEPVREGERNQTLTSLAGSLRYRGADRETILAAISEVNARRFEPPLPEAEVRGIAASVARYEPAVQGNGSAPGGDATQPGGVQRSVGDEVHLTDLGNAKRLVARYGSMLRHVATWDRWLVWDGRRWARDETGQVARLAKRVALDLYVEARDIRDEDFRKKTVAHALRSESESRLTAMIELAKTEPGIPVTPAELDTDSWKLNCVNGTIDLRTGELLRHRREDLITKLAPVEFDPAARLGLWDRFLERVQPHAESRAFLLRAMGYSIAGTTAEERLFLAYGKGATGKSTFLEAVRAALGDYAMTADFETFLKRNNVTGGPRNDIARLAGARLVVSFEVEDGRRLAEGVLKQLTGGDTVTARFLHKESFEFRPTFTPWLAANHRPRVRDDDDAIWRRIVQVPFDVQIPETERDPAVKATLRDPAAAGPAVLASLVRGCLAYQHQGLAIPEAVRAATEEYRQEMDPLAGFYADWCEFGPDGWVPWAKLNEAYQQWCKDNHERWPLPAKDLRARLRARGCADKRHGQVRGWAGISLTADGSLFEDDSDSR